MPVQALQCKECRQTYPLDARYVCETCFGPLEVAYDLSPLDPAETKRRIQAGPQTIWRYSDFLPFEGPPAPGLPVGLTPLQNAPRLAEALGLREVWVKNDTANPTHSFKDRVVAIAVAKAQELGYSVVACPSTGNLANAVAAHSAAAGLDSFVFIPADLEEQKVLATGVYGTTLVAVKGTYDDVNRLCTELSGERDWAFVNVNVRPYYAEGSKTVAFEICEQLGFELPDRIVAPVASGSLFTKIARGIEEWLEVGLVEGELPTFNGAQAEGCSPVAQAFEADHDVCRPVRWPNTIAKSLAIGNPADGPYALDLARRSGGSVDSVTDDEIRAGIRLLAQTTGLFTETAGGVTTATLKKLAERGDIGRDERVVLVITGDGLKTLDAVRGSFERHEIEPTLESFESTLSEAAIGAV
jgi:threonine synthase